MYIDSHIQKLERVAWEDPRGEYLRLDMNENPHGLPEAFFRRVWNGMTPAYLATYPEQKPLLLAIAAREGIKAENICLTNGSDDALRLIFQVFGRPRSCAVTLSPTFEMYMVYCRMYGITQRAIPVEEDFSLPVEAFLDAIDEDVSIVAALNPNSPAGRPWSEEEMGRIIEKTRAVGAILIIDEAYHYFYEHTFLPLAMENEHVVVLRTFSKVCAIAGCRIGYAAGSAVIAEHMRRASSTYAVNTVALRLAQAVLEEPGLIAMLAQEERQGREFLMDELRRRGYAPVHNGGNYVLFRPKTSPAQLFAALEERGILIKTYKSGLLSGYVRVTTADATTMKRFTDALAAAEGSV